MKDKLIPLILLTLSPSLPLSAATITLSIPTITSDPGESDIRVPVNISDVTGLGIISAQMTILYDPDLVVAKRIEFGGTIAQGVSSAYAVGNGKIKLAFTRANPFEGSGVLVFILFDLLPKVSGGQTPLVMSNVKLNEGKGFELKIGNGELRIKSGNPPPTLGDVSGDGEITIFDAALLLQYIVGLIELTPQQRELADVSRNGRITAYDVALILQYVVGNIKSF